MICDIKNSRKLENREAVQYKLIETLKEINEVFTSDITVPFIITMGDEWQGLLHENCDPLKIISFFHQKMPEIDFYCGLGIGEVSINNFELTVNQLDGPSFYKARRAIKIAKQYKYSEVMIK